MNRTAVIGLIHDRDKDFDSSQSTGRASRSSRRRVKESETDTNKKLGETLNPPLRRQLKLLLRNRVMRLRGTSIFPGHLEEEIWEELRKF
jgi:hypothetical protein